MYFFIDERNKLIKLSSIFRLQNYQPVMGAAKDIGNKGESVAAEFLAQKGYKILCKNWYCYNREIDIIAQYEDTVVFVEVKTRKFGSIISAKESITNKKQKLLVDAANLFLQKNNIDLESRFDIICISYQNNQTVIEHIENAFYPSAMNKPYR
jgi:putative endonuclease